MTRTVILTRPGTGGMAPDRAPYLLDRDQALETVNGAAPKELLTQRRGWNYHGAQLQYQGSGGAVPVTERLYSVWRQSYLLADRVVTARLAGLESFAADLSGAQRRALDTALDRLLERDEIASIYRSHRRTSR